MAGNKIYILGGCYLLINVSSFIQNVHSILDISISCLTLDVQLFMKERLQQFELNCATNCEAA
jgi:hypothetical protein